MTDPDAPPVFQQAQIVCLVGSLRFRKAYEAANRLESAAGHIVLTAPYFTERASADDPSDVSPVDGFRMDTLGLKKVALCNEVLVLNVGGYIGPSTANQIEYALKLGKHVRYLEPLDAKAERVSLLAFREGCVLLVKGPRGVALPGGGVRRGESQPEALRRIAPEQTGLKALHLGPHITTVDGPDARDHVYSVVVGDERPRAGEGVENAWWASTLELDAVRPGPNLATIEAALRVLRERYGAA